MIQRTVRLSEAPSFGKPVLLYEATSIGARNYIGLAKEVINANKTYLQKEEANKRSGGPVAAGLRAGNGTLASRPVPDAVVPAAVPQPSGDLDSVLHSDSPSR